MEHINSLRSGIQETLNLSAWADSSISLPYKRVKTGENGLHRWKREGGGTERGEECPRGIESTIHRKTGRRKKTFRKIAWDGKTYNLQPCATDIGTYRMNWPRGRFSAKLKSTGLIMNDPKILVQKKRAIDNSPAIHKVEGNNNVQSCRKCRYRLKIIFL